MRLRMLRFNKKWFFAKVKPGNPMQHDLNTEYEVKDHWIRLSDQHSEKELAKKLRHYLK